MNYRLLHIAISMFAVLSVRGHDTTASPSIEWADSVISLPAVSVSSLKTGTHLRHHAVSITRIDSSAISTMRIDNLHRVSDMTPNLYMPRYGSRITSSIYVRGIGARIDQPAVGLIVDNIPIMTKDNYDFDIPNVAHIDMIRGPQNVMYGRNTMAGLINISTMSPDDYQGYNINLSGGSHKTLRTTIEASDRISSHVALAYGLSEGYTDGYYRNEYNGRKVGKEHQEGTWYKLSWRPTHNWHIENTGRYNHNKQSGYPYELLSTHKIAYNDTCFYHRKSWLDGLTVAWRQGKWQVTSVTSVQHIDDNMTLDQDFTPQDYFTITQRRHETVVTEDITLKHDSRHYSWIAGVSGFTRHTTMRAPVTFLSTGIDRLIVANRNEMNPLYPIKWNTPNFVLNSDFSHPTKGLGLYHRSAFKLGRFDIDASARLEIEQPQLDYHSYTSTAYTIYDNTKGHSTIYEQREVNIDEQGSLSHTYVRLLPSISLTYRLPGLNDGNFYLSVAQGYKSGGYNTQMFSDFLQQQLMEEMGLTAKYSVDDIISYRPEYSFNYEAGTHLSLIDNRLTLDGSLFYIDCRDQQLTRFPDGLTTGRVMTNAGHTRSLGCETSGSFEIDRHWMLSASWGLADARFVKYTDGKEDYSGRHVPYAPVNTLSASLRFTSAIPTLHIDEVTMFTGVRGVGPIYWNEANTVRQDFYAPLELSLSATSGPFTLKAWCENINNVKYATFYFKSMGNGFIQRGAPTTWGISLKVNINALL